MIEEPLFGSDRPMRTVDAFGFYPAGLLHNSD